MKVFRHIFDRAQRPHPREHRGVALVITLILLAVITFMAITFLVVSRSERGSVSTSTDQLTAKLAADNAFNRATADLLAPIIAFTNEYDYDLIVSTNFINNIGFEIGNSSPTNVSYVYPNGTPLAGNDLLQNISNLLYYPRPPVFITDRRAGVQEFRYYLDLNRNNRHDTNGLLPVINPLGGYYDTNGNWIAQPIPGLTASNWFVGDPEWIGGLEFPDKRHSADNKFLYRYAYLVVPEGKTLDINNIHNYAKRLTAPMQLGQDGFRRNMGVGSWELNLAGFLVDLNTNMWPYPVSLGPDFYQPYFYAADGVNSGSAFADALELLRYRYDATFGTLRSVSQLYPSAANRFRTDFIDAYSSAPLMIGSWPLVDTDDPTIPWSGAENTNGNAFFTHQDFFRKSRLLLNQPAAGQTFTDRLLLAGTRTDSYNRYTFYRLLSQMGTDSAPDTDTRMNLNYDNLVQGSSFNNVKSTTNFFEWDALAFFTNAAERLLSDGAFAPPLSVVNGKTTHLSVTNIPIHPTNFYSASVHRALQLAANMYDSTTNYSLGMFGPGQQLGLPTVFRPYFRKQNVNGSNVVSIVGYDRIFKIQDLTNNGARMRDLESASDMAAAWGPNDMVYGTPLVVGAKKGFPNFNEFAMLTTMQVSRKLQFRRPSINLKVNETNQMYLVSLTNVFAMEAWNSYSNNFPLELTMQAAADVTCVLSNQFGIMISNAVPAVGYITNIPANAWRGYTVRGAFQVPISNMVAFISEATYRSKTRTFEPRTSPGSADFERNINGTLGFEVPNWWLTMRARMRFVLTLQDGSIVDYVNLEETERTVDIAATLQEGGGDPPANGSPGALWLTNRVGGGNSVLSPTYGIENQILVCVGRATANWQSANATPVLGNDVAKARDGFKYNMDLVGPIGAYGNETFHKSNVFYAPFNPKGTMYQTTKWQANDPLVHYTVGDLQDLLRTNNVTPQTDNPPLANIGKINERYEPWGGAPGGKSTSPTFFEPAIKDPLVTRSDDWQFPTNKYPNIGWIGRVHRGTPWQTVYLKSSGVNLNAWKKWSGNGTRVYVGKNLTDDATFTLPSRDRNMLDLFTATLNDTASRGQLSVNQTNLAAWSAVFSGVVALTNSLPDALFAAEPDRGPVITSFTNQPAGYYDQLNKPALVRIVDAINGTRATNFNKGVFARLGDILATPELTVGSNPYYVGTYPNGFWSGVSPFINLGNPGEADPNAADIAGRYTLQQRRGITEEAYERLPQQILGLLRGRAQPRFTVYSYGQALKPADRSLVTTGGPFFGLCTNYQVTAEVATRTVVRVEGAPDKPKLVFEQFNVLPPD